MRRVFSWLCLWCALPVLLPNALGKEPHMVLADEGATQYVIMAPAESSGVDDYAVRILSEYLEQMTGAKFPVATRTSAADQRVIAVGISDVSRQRLGEENPVADLREGEHIVRAAGGDLFLYGEGIHGNLSAVNAFLHQLGWRWYSVHEPPVVPSRPRLALEPLDTRQGFVFVSRLLAARFGTDFYLQNDVNAGLESKSRRRGQEPPPHLRDYLPTDCFVHSSFSYIPPAPDNRYANRFAWQTKRDYFATNPEYFSMNEQGVRVPTDQLCFAGRGLRDELTRVVLEHIERSGERMYVTIDAADHPGKFCHCEGCKALEATYQSPGGPLYDYLIELCGVLAEKHSPTFVKTLAYRRAQTQKPPVLPAGERLPENLIIEFAPIEDNYFGDWSHPDEKLQETYADLVAWSKITPHLWAWIYPNPWGTGMQMPVGNVQRVVTNFRKMHEAGVTGIFADHNGFLSRSGFSELQTYLMMRLARDIDVDTEAVIKEFTDHRYGPAAPLMRQYLAELEAGRLAMRELSGNITYKSAVFNDRTFPYLTVANIHRWQLLVDEMLETVKDDATRTQNVQLLRRELDLATLWKWSDLQEAHPDYYSDADVLTERIAAIENQPTANGDKLARTLGGAVMRDFKMKIDAGGKEKPLPARFDGIDPERIRTYTIPRGKKVLDPEAAYGFATVVDQPDYPLRYGFFQWRSRTPNVTIMGPRQTLRKADMAPDTYALYPLGTIKIEVLDSLIHIGKSWMTSLKVGELLYEPGAGNEWDAFLSLKVEGPTYGGKGPDDRVLVDRVILVSQSPDQFGNQENDRGE